MGTLKTGKKARLEGVDKFVGLYKGSTNSLEGKNRRNRSKNVTRTDVMGTVKKKKNGYNKKKR